MDLLISLLLILAVIAVYFFPAILANRRQARHEVGIFWINLFLGWTVLGWFAVLIWSLAETDPRVIPQRLLNSRLAGWLTDITRGLKFERDDKSKGRVQFRRNGSDAFFSE
jgi:hypothetical protein